MTDQGRETRILTIQDRAIVVRRITDAQMMLMARELKLAQQDGTENRRRLEAIGRCFDIFDSAVVQDSDRSFLMDLITRGELELKDLTPIFSVFSEEEDESPKVRRARTSRTKP